MKKPRKKFTFRFKPPEERFHAKYRVDPVTGCWVWQSRQAGDKKRPLYPTILLEKYGPRVPASHYSLQLAGRPIEPGQFACHHCDNPPCVNPDHLFAGTQTDNLRDAMRKGRAVTPGPYDWTGRQHTPETKARIAAYRRARWASLTPEAKEAEAEARRKTWLALPQEVKDAQLRRLAVGRSQPKLRAVVKRKPRV